MPCPAPTWQSNRPCNRPPAPNSAYCQTHQLFLDGPTSPKPLNLRHEVTLTRLQIRNLVDQKAPATAILNALRTLALLVRLQSRLDQATRPKPQTRAPRPHAK